MSLNFDASPEDADLIDQCAQRAAQRWRAYNKLDVALDLTVANNAVPLDLARLLAFDDSNFAHDICGIARHLNRKKGVIEDRFLPRCAR